MKQKQRALCLVFALFITVFFLSGLFLTLEHDCTHESCQVCSFVTSIKQILAALCLALVAYGISAAAVQICHSDLSKIAYAKHAVTPITLKVKLSD